MQYAMGGRSGNGEESPDTAGQEARLKSRVPLGKPVARTVPQKTNRPARGKGEKAGQEPTVCGRNAVCKANPFRCKAK